MEGIDLIEEQNIQLIGGRIGKISRVGDRVCRPTNSWTPTVHDFLKFLNDHGADFVPIPYGIDGDKEFVSFIQGDVYNDPYPKIFTEDVMIISAAKLLSRFHELSKRYIKNIDNKSKWMLSPVHPIEMICHGDFAPYNTVIVDEKATALIDFDTIHPGPKIWDVSYAIYRWISFIDDDEENFAENMRKIKLFLATYEMIDKSKELLINVLIDRLQSLVNFMKSEALAGNMDFQKNMNDGHLQKYIDDIDYLKKNERRIINAII